MNYSFAWALTGPLTPGIPFLDRDQVTADPNDALQNRIGFGFDNGTYGFVPAPSGGTTPPGALGIEVLPTVPDNTTSVGIGMGGSPVLALQAEPGATVQFTPHPSYWITVGNYSVGEVLEVEEITNAVEIPFGDTFSMHAVLGQNGVWAFSQ